MRPPRSFPYVIQDVLPGSKYRLLQTLGVGGSAVVWEAENAAIGRIVAIKVLFPEVAAKGHFDEEQMNREARILSGLHALTPHVVDVLDAGVTADAHRLPYIVMEKLSGMTLRESIRRRASKNKPFAVVEIVHLCLEVATALAHAHENEIVHRDIKPENIFLARGREGEQTSVKVLDFGISSWTDDVAVRSPVLKGTLRYMAPEQFRRQRVVPATDVYAIGLILFELVTMECPFEIGGRKLERGEFEYVHCQVTPPLVSDFRADVPPSLVALIAACLDKDPGRRPQGGSALTKVFKRLRDEFQKPKTLSHIAAISDVGAPPFAFDGTTDVGVAPFVPHSPEPPQIVRGDDDVPRGAITSVSGLDSISSGADRSEVFVSRTGMTGDPIVPTPTIIVLGAATPVAGVQAATGLSIDRTIPDPLPPFGCDPPPLSAPDAAVLAPPASELHIDAAASHSAIVAPAVSESLLDAPAPADSAPRIVRERPKRIDGPDRVDSFTAEQARIEFVRAQQQLRTETPQPDSSTPSFRSSDISSEGQSFEPVTDENLPPTVRRELHPNVLPTVVFSAVVAVGTALAWMVTRPTPPAAMTARGLALPALSAPIVDVAPPVRPVVSAGALADAAPPTASAPTASASMRGPQQRVFPGRPAPSATPPPPMNTSEFELSLPPDVKPDFRR